MTKQRHTYGGSAIVFLLRDLTVIIFLVVVTVHCNFLFILVTWLWYM